MPSQADPGLELEERLLEEKLRRWHARRELAAYIGYVNPAAQFPAHQKKIIGALEKVRRGEIKRLRINCPPRHGKSFCISQHFPAQYISTTPRSKIIHSSHTLSLVQDFGRDIRDLLDGPENQRLYPGVRLMQSSKAAGRFRSTNGCHYYAAGTGGSLLIIGSAAGIAFMGLERVDFFAYLKKSSLPALAGYLTGIALYALELALR